MSLTEEEDNINKMTDTDEIILEQKICKSTSSSRFNLKKAMTICTELIAFLHPICSYSVYLVMPYYVLSTPEKGWGTSDLGLFFSSIAIGEIAGSQIVPITAILDSDKALFIGHAIQIIAAFIGYFCMSSIIFFNVWIFAVGMFLLGFSYGMSCVQAYCTEIADGDENLELDLMAKIGQLYIIAHLVFAFVIPPLYDSMGFTAYCIVMMLLCMVMFIAFVILVIAFKSKQKEYDLLYETGETDDEEVELPQDNCTEKINISHQNTMNSVNSVISVSLDGTHIPILSILSPSMYVLLLLKVAQCFVCQIYYISYPVVFSTVFNISSAVGGLLYAAASVLGIVALFVNSKITQYVWSGWGYPFDLILGFVVLSISGFGYVTVYQQWIGFSFHLLVVASIFVLSGVEMTSRLYLCPSQAFQQITGIVGVLQAATYLLGSIVTPILLNISLKLPFLVIAVLTFIVSLLTLIVYLFRKRFLNSKFNDDAKLKLSYLTKERTFYSNVAKSSYRRGAISADKQVSIVSLMDDINHKLTVMQQQFSSQRGVSFLFNPNATRRMEQFANTTTINAEIAENTSNNLNNRHNPNALIQLDELQEIGRNDHDDNSEKKKVSIISAASIQRTERTKSVTMQSQLKMRKSMYVINNKKRKKKKMSMARASIFRTCEPAIGLNDNEVCAEKEAARRAKVITNSRASVFMMG